MSKVNIGKKAIYLKDKSIYKINGYLDNTNEYVISNGNSSINVKPDELEIIGFISKILYFIYKIIFNKK